MANQFPSSKTSPRTRQSTKDKAPRNKAAHNEASKDKSSRDKSPEDQPSQQREVAGIKVGLHPRNRHRERYDFRALIESSPELAGYVAVNAYGDESIDFADATAVKALNQALLQHHYRIQGWDIPEGYLCPPIPGRSDYLHHVADLLASADAGVIPTGEGVRVLDIGIGANGVYALIGQREYGWHFVGIDIDGVALDNVRRVIDRNPDIAAHIELRLQPDKKAYFRGAINAGELYDLTLCNPPFHASSAEAEAGTRRKWQNLGKQVHSPQLNFGGQSAELVCPGGEEAFISAMIAESKRFSTQCLWFTSLVSRSATLPAVYRALRSVGAVRVKTVEMAQGQKKSRFVAWSFFNENQQRAWHLRKEKATP